MNEAWLNAWTGADDKSSNAPVIYNADTGRVVNAHGAPTLDDYLDELQESDGDKPIVCLPDNGRVTY